MVLTMHKYQTVLLFSPPSYWGRLKSSAGTQDLKCLHGGGSTNRPCLKETPLWVKINLVRSCLPSVLRSLWKKFNKMAWEKDKWRSAAVLLGTKSQNLFGDESSSYGVVCWRSGSREGRICASVAWLKAIGTSPTFRGLQASSSWGSREDWNSSVKRKCNLLLWKAAVA